MPTRREFLYQLGAGTLGVLGLKILPGCETIDVTSKIGGDMVNFITPGEDGTWYWQSGNATAKDEAPEIAREDWKLAIHDNSGQVGEIAFSDLQSAADAGEAITYIKTMRCVYGLPVGTAFDTLVSTGVFTGIPLHKILDQFDFPEGIKKLRTFGDDGFESNLDWSRATQPGPEPLPAILAYELNGQQLSKLRGGPVRLIIPEMWGYKNMKWLTKVEATPKRKNAEDEYFGTYEAERNFGEHQELIDGEANIALTSSVTQPATNEQEVEGPDVTIAGTSFAGSRAVSGVELKLDDGPWETVEYLTQKEARATIDPSFTDAFDAAEQVDGPWPPPNVWAIWSRTYEGLSNGSHTVKVRATDANDNTQAENTDNRFKVAKPVSVNFEVT